MIQIAFNDMMEIMGQSPKDIHSIHTSTLRHSPDLPKDRGQIKNIIDSMINIQATLARHYVYKRAFGFTRLTDPIFPTTHGIEREIDMFTSVFNEVIVSKATDGTPIDIQVSHASELAYGIFAEMIIENTIDKYIRHLTIERPFIQDLSKNAYFVIDRSKSDIVKNRYYDYLINGSLSPYMLNPMYIDVSGFRIDEIENDDYVQQLAAQVTHLFLMIFKQVTPNLTFYSKQLRWYV